MAHILIVDDEEAIRDLIKEVLAINGHSFDMAANGAEALEKIRGKKYDLVIMDRNMPKMTGIQAATMIRTNPKYNDLKIIMCTSASIAGEVDEAFQAGATDYILKPINLQLLSGKVAKHLAAKP